jgi:hypothetical protein
VDKGRLGRTVQAINIDYHNTSSRRPSLVVIVAALANIADPVAYAP